MWNRTSPRDSEVKDSTVSKTPHSTEREILRDRRTEGPKGNRDSSGNTQDVGSNVRQLKRVKG